MTIENVALVERLLNGQVTAIDRVTGWTEAEFAQIAPTQSLVVSAKAVVRALLALQSGDVTSVQAQAWGDFVMHGFIPGVVPRPRRGLDIEYDPLHEDAVATAVMRLSELGDLIDGEFRPGEIDQLVAALNGPPEPSPS